MIKYKVTLTKKERTELETISSQGNHKSQKVLNALILLNCDEGKFQKNRSKNEDVSNSSAWKLVEYSGDRTQCFDRTMFEKEN